MSLKLRLVFSEEKRPYLLDVSSILYDMELLHDFALILCAEDYSEYEFDRFFWYRKGRPIKAAHKVRAIRIVKESPLVIVIGVTEILLTTGALWALVQAIEKVSNWKLNKEKLRYEVEKLKLEVQEKRINVEQKAQEREASRILDTLLNRLESNPIKLEDIEIESEEKDKG